MAKRLTTPKSRCYTSLISLIIHVSARLLLFLFIYFLFFLFSDTNISQGSVATRLRRGGIFYHHFVRNLLLRLSTHYTLPVFTGRVHGPWTRSGREHGPWTRIVCTELKSVGERISKVDQHLTKLEAKITVAPFSDTVCIDSSRIALIIA